MLRPWKTVIQFDVHSGRAVYQQIALAIMEEIRRGRLQPGTPLPGSRVLAEDLGVNRKTVILAYEELAIQGWVSSEQKRGTFVSEKIPENLPQHFASREPSAQRSDEAPNYSFRRPFAVQAEEALPAGTIVFTDGTPDVRMAPIKPLASAYRSVLLAKGRRNMLGYGEAKGSLDLRDTLSDMLNADRGLTTTPDSICITRGSQMALFLVAQVLCKPKDVVIIEELSYPPLWEAFRWAGAELVSVQMDQEGICVEQVETLCKKGKVKALCLTPHHQFPTTITLKADRRLRLLELANRYNIAIIEDDYDHEFHYSFKPILPLASADSIGSVIYIGSLSKLIAPGLRIGYVAAHRSFIAQLSAFRTIIDRQGDSILEQSVAGLMVDGELKRHARKAQNEYLLRRDALAKSLKSELGEWVNFRIPEGGMALWVAFSDAIDVNQLAQKALLQHVAFTPGEQFSFTKTSKVNAARLGFASLTIAELEEGVRRIKKAILYR